MKVWKALFYSMWHSDKIPVQQELAFHIARLTRRLYNPNSSKFEALDERVFCFLRAFWRTMQREWMGIDHLRLDKFMSLTRRMIHEGFVFVAKKGFAEAVSKRLCKDVLSLALADRPNGIRFHTIDCWVDEIATAAGATITTPQLQLLMAPIYEHCIDTDEKILFERIVKEILRPLAERTVEVQAPAEEDDESAAGAGGKDGKKSFETPLLMDAHARQEALASAFKKVDLCLLAKDVFAIAALG